MSFSERHEICRAVASTQKARLPALEALRLVLSIGKNRGQKFDRTYEISRDKVERKLLCLSLYFKKELAFLTPSRHGGYRVQRTCSRVAAGSKVRGRERGTLLLSDHDAH